MTHQPTAGDMYAVYLIPSQTYEVYQFVRYHEGKANQIASTDILPFEVQFDEISNIDIHQLPIPPKYKRGEWETDDEAIYNIENHWGYIPQDHIFLGNLPLVSDGRPNSYGGGDMNHSSEPYYQAYYCSNQPDFDMQKVYQEFPKLRDLSIFDANIQHFSVLENLADLRSLTLIRCQVAEDDGANLTKLSHLNIVWISGFSYAVGSVLKKQIQAIAKQKPKQFTYQVTGLRKPEWYIANENNPFVAFDEENIPKKDVKACVKIYKDSLKTAMSYSLNQLSPNLEKLAEEYALKFNQFGWIETFHREIICDAFYTIVQALEKKYGIKIDLDTIQSAIDSVRDW